MFELVIWLLKRIPQDGINMWDGRVLRPALVIDNRPVVSKWNRLRMAPIRECVSPCTVRPILSRDRYCYISICCCID